MENNRKQFGRSKQSGFTLLLAALVASIVLSLGAAIYTIAYKQVALSAIGRDSQFAFYAADTLAECALYWDIKLGVFPETTPSGTLASTITCDGQNLAIEVQNDSDQTQENMCDFSIVGGVQVTTCPSDSETEFQIPDTFDSMTVTVKGGGGGGGGGARCTNIQGGSNGIAGIASAFGDLVGAGGGLGTGANANCAVIGSSGSEGVAGGDGNGAAGGGGGPNSSGSFRGANGGAGGSGVDSYVSVPSFSHPCASDSSKNCVTVTVGQGGGGGSGGCGGFPSSCGSSGSSGQNGDVHIEWTGSATAWSQTTFTFPRTLLNDGANCAEATVVKSAGAGNTVNILVDAQGYNVPCQVVDSSPQALQRAVRFIY